MPVTRFSSCARLVPPCDHVCLSGIVARAVGFVCASWGSGVGRRSWFCLSHAASTEGWVQGQGGKGWGCADLWCLLRQHGRSTEAMVLLNASMSRGLFV